jgi:hypothetical protein
MVCVWAKQVADVKWVYEGKLVSYAHDYKLSHLCLSLFSKNNVWQDTYVSASNNMQFR